MPSLGKGGVMEKQKVKIEEKMSCAALAECLRKLASDLDSGRLEARSGEKTISFSVPESLPVEIEAKHKENKEKIAIEISWREMAAQEVGGEIPAGTEVEMGAGSVESAYGVEKAEEATDGGGSEAPAPTGEMPENDIREAPGSEEMDLLAGGVTPAGSFEDFAPAVELPEADSSDSFNPEEAILLPEEPVEESEESGSIASEPVAEEGAKSTQEAKPRPRRKRR
jgi:amphi-Trp domain-containing protein